MPKRESLTGGTGDVNPQWYKMRIIQDGSGFNNAINQSFQLPITRVPQNKKVTIMEILKVYWFYSSLAQVSNTVEQQIQGMLTTANPGVSSGTVSNVPFITDGSIIDQFSAGSYFDISGDTTYPAVGITRIQPIIHDLTDGAGHGFLVATDQIYLTLAPTNVGVNNSSISCWLYYRFKTVGIEEYVGIVQSQSNL